MLERLSSIVVVVPKLANWGRPVVGGCEKGLKKFKNRGNEAEDLD